jgi:hypothetical protein
MLTHLTPICTHTHTHPAHRVHYPLPLLFDQNQNPAALKKQVRLLNRKVTQLVEERECNMEEITRLLKQNDKLKHDMKVNRLSLATLPSLAGGRGGRPLPDLLDALRVEAADEIDAIYGQIEAIANLNSGLQVSRIDRHLSRLQAIVQTLLLEAGESGHRARPSAGVAPTSSNALPAQRRSSSKSRSVQGPGYRELPPARTRTRSRSQSAGRLS